MTAIERKLRTADRTIRELQAERHVLETSIASMTEWVVDVLGYPIDMFTTTTVPVSWQRLIEEEWVRRSGDVREDAAAIRRYVAESGGWSDDEARSADAERLRALIYRAAKDALMQEEMVPDRRGGPS